MSIKDKNLLKKKVKTKKQLEELKEKKRVAIAETRMKHLVDYTAGKNIRLQAANIWAFDPKEKIMYYAIDGPVGIKSMTKQEFIGVTLHEISHAKYTNTFEELTPLLSPKREYQILLNALEDCRIERKLVREFPGTEDSFVNYQENMAKNLYSEEDLLKFPEHLNLTLNIIRLEYGFDPYINSKRVTQFLTKHSNTIQKAVSQPTTVALQNVVNNELWEDFKELIPEKWLDPPEGASSDQPYVSPNSHIDQSDEQDESKSKKDEEKKDPGNPDQLIKNNKGGEDEEEKNKPQPPKPQTGIAPPEEQKEDEQSAKDGNDSKEEGDQEEGDQEGGSGQDGDDSEESDDEKDSSGGGEKSDKEKEEEEGDQSSGGGEEGDEEKEDESESNSGSGEEDSEEDQSSGAGEEDGAGPDGSDLDQGLQDRLKNSFDMHDIANSIKDIKMEAGEIPPTPKKDSFMEDVEKELEQQMKNDKDLSEPSVLTGTELREALSSYYRKDFEELYESVQPNVPYFANKLKNIMRDNNARRHGGAYKSGKLAGKFLYKAKTKSELLFRRRILRNHKKYSISLVIDQSGSMSGDKSIEAAKAAVLMAEVLHSIENLGVEFEVFGFNTHEKHYKKFDQPYNWAVRRNLECVITEATGDGAGGNNDAYAVHMAGKRLLQRDGERIMLVFSDGRPANTYGAIPKHARKLAPKNKTNYSDFDLKTEVHLAKDQMNVIGIGIQDDSVAAYYPEYFVIEEVDELPRLLLNILKKHIKRG